MAPHLAQAEQGLVAARHELRDARIGSFAGAMREDVHIVAEHDLDRVHAEPFERLLQRAHHAVIGIVEALAAGGHVEEFALARSLERIANLEYATHLGGEQRAGWNLFPQKAVQPCLGKAKSVKRRGVEIADADIPRRLQRGGRLFLAQGTIQIPKRGGAEANRGEADARA